jgi:GNAT superfamily N-acetyltransferase
MAEVSARIRTSRADEAEQLFTVQRSSALAAFAHIFDPIEHPFPDQAERNQWSTYLESAGTTVFVAEVNDAPVGVAVVTGETLERLFVVPERWGSGIGTLLHDAVLRLLSEQGGTQCALWVLTENHQARGFYERRGWKLDGRTRQAQFPPFPPAVGYTIEL